MQNLYLLEYSAEAFWCHTNHYQCLAVLVKLAVMEFVFRFIRVGIAEILVISDANHTNISAIPTYELENKPHHSQFHWDCQTLKIVHMAPKSFC